MNILDYRPGILPRHFLEEINDNIIFDCSKIDHSAIDLTLGNVCWKMKGSLRLTKDLTFETISTNESYTDKQYDLRKEMILEPRKTYVIQLKEYFRNNHNNDIHGVATGKSSIGRLDVLTRLLVNGHNEYDTVPINYNGPLYLEVTPITFPIKVKTGYSLNQLRLFRGKPELSLITAEELKLYRNLTFLAENQSHLTLNLEPDEGYDTEVIAFKALSPDNEDNFRPIDIGKEKNANPREYWETVKPNAQKDILIEKDKFYIMRSKERFSLPEDVGVYCQAITENLGEIRIHYAGFVHPGFGMHREDEKGTPLIFEIRGHSVSAFLRHGELMAKISFYKTSSPVNFDNNDIDIMKKESYNNQELTLSKFLSAWSN